MQNAPVGDTGASCWGVKVELRDWEMLYTELMTEVIVSTGLLSPDEDPGDAARPGIRYGWFTFIKVLFFLNCQCCPNSFTMCFSRREEKVILT